MFFLMVGPSGAGKDTLIDGARRALAGDPRWVFTTRVITRPADAGGEHHLAMSEAGFSAAEGAGEFLITWSAHGFRYGLPKALAADIGAGRHVIANGSRATIAQLARRVPRLTVVVVSAPSDALKDRIAGRARESGDTVATRLGRRVDLVLPEDVGRVNVVNDGTVDEGVARFVAAIVAAVP